MRFKMAVSVRNLIGNNSSLDFLVFVVESRYIGYCVGARDLTWSYVAFQTASDARQRLMNAIGKPGLQFQSAPGLARSRDVKRVNFEGDGFGRSAVMQRLQTFLNWAIPV